jgi:hypothetical protein
MSALDVKLGAFVGAVNEVMAREINDVIYRYSTEQFRIMHDLVRTVDGIDPRVQAKVRSALLARLDADIQICRENIDVERRDMAELTTERDALQRGKE